MFIIFHVRLYFWSKSPNFGTRGSQEIIRVVNQYSPAALIERSKRRTSHKMQYIFRKIRIEDIRYYYFSARTIDEHNNRQCKTKANTSLFIRNKYTRQRSNWSVVYAGGGEGRWEIYSLPRGVFFFCIFIYLNVTFHRDLKISRTKSSLTNTRID